MDNTLKLSDHELNKILQEKFSTPSYELEILDTDIFVCGLPRSGTTWLSEMVWLISHDLDYENAKNNLLERMPILDGCFSFDDNIMRGADALVNSIECFENKPSPRCMRTHLPFQLLPKTIQNGEKKPKIIYIARNPLDVCVSSYYNSKNFYFNGTIEEYCKLFLHGLVYAGPYFEHVLTYWKLRNQSNVLFLKYEDIKQDTGKVIQQIASFLGNMIPDEKMPTLQEHLSFESIKNNDAVNGKYFHEIMKQLGKTKPITPFIRSGKVGGYKEELPQEYLEIFKKWMEKELETTGLTFKV